MNYYERYCGDYARDTAHLVLAEHGAYTLMLDFYYSAERPLPAEYPPLYRLCRAITKVEQATVRKVADEFFPIRPDGLRHNKRADADLAKARKRINAVKENGAKGGRPKKPSNNLLGFQQEPSRVPSSPHMVSPPDPRPHTSNREVGVTPPTVAVVDNFVSKVKFANENNKNHTQKLTSGQQWDNPAWVAATAKTVGKRCLPGEEFDAFRDRIYGALQAHLLDSKRAAK